MTLVRASAAATMLAWAPAIALAQPVHHVHHRHHYRSSCEAARHRSANTGTVLGAVGGGIIGSQLAGGGSRTLGTLLGAGGGAVVGHQIGANSHRC
jgi:uncharacterized protein YcfJ